jgi:hypothetical protein
MGPAGASIIRLKRRVSERDSSPLYTVGHFRPLMPSPLLKEGRGYFGAGQFFATLYPAASASSTVLNLTWFFSDTLL